MDDFDYLNEALNRMYWSTAPDPDDPKKKTVRVPKCDETNFMHTDEFKEICIRYPGYEDEFIYLISTYFGNTFMNIPSEILGYYCNLDSYMTIMIRNQLKDDYTDTCLSIYLDNVRLGARLHSSGMYKDEDYHARYQFQCDTLQSYGMTYAATCYTKLKLDYLRYRIPDVNKFNDSFRVLLSRDEMRNGDVVKIAKTIISNNLSDLYESGLDEPMIYEIYGEGIYNALIEGLKDAGCKAELSLMRKKKPFTFIADRLAKELGLDQLNIDSIKIDKNHSKDLARYFNIENIIDLLSQYFLCEEGYKGFLDIWKNQMTDIYHIPLKFKFMGETLSSKEYVDRVKKKFFPCTSPKEYGPMLEFLVDKYKVESSFLSMIYNNLNKIEIKKIFDSMYGKDGDRKPLNYCFDHFINNIVSYPDELKEIIQMYLNDPYGERMTDTFDDARGFWKQADYWDTEIRYDYDTLSQPYSEDDFNDTFKFLRKMCINIQLFNKYRKVDSTYINGLFKSFDKVVHDTPKLIPDVAWDNTRNDNVVKMFPRYLVCEKDTKRWSSGYHTIISHSDIKRIVTAPPGYLLTYFDINLNSVA